MGIRTSMLADIQQNLNKIIDLCINTKDDDDMSLEMRKCFSELGESWIRIKEFLIRINRSIGSLSTFIPQDFAFASKPAEEVQGPILNNLDELHTKLYGEIRSLSAAIRTILADPIAKQLIKKPELLERLSSLVGNIETILYPKKLSRIAMRGGNAAIQLLYNSVASQLVHITTILNDDTDPDTKSIGERLLLSLKMLWKILRFVSHIAELLEFKSFPIRLFAGAVQVLNVSRENLGFNIVPEEEIAQCKSDIGRQVLGKYWANGLSYIDLPGEKTYDTYDPLILRDKLDFLDLLVHTGVDCTKAVDPIMTCESAEQLKFQKQQLIISMPYHSVLPAGGSEAADEVGPASLDERRATETPTAAASSTEPHTEFWHHMDLRPYEGDLSSDEGRKSEPPSPQHDDKKGEWIPMSKIH